MKERGVRKGERENDRGGEGGRERWEQKGGVGSVVEEERRSRESGGERESAKQGKEGDDVRSHRLADGILCRRNNFSKFYWPTALKFFVS